jgi:hypothetical protein
MAKDKKKSRSGKSKKLDKKAKKKLAAQRKAKLRANKGDGTFPDRLIVTREKEKTAGEGGKEKTSHWFLGHNEDLGTIYKDETVVAVYKLVRVSQVVVKKKIALNRV